MFFELILSLTFPPPPQLPKAKETGAMTSAGFMRLVRNVGDSIAKIAGKKSESDTVRERSVPHAPPLWPMPGQGVAFLALPFSGLRSSRGTMSCWTPI